jgi:hypothetical protein
MFLVGGYGLRVTGYLLRVAVHELCVVTFGAEHLGIRLWGLVFSIYRLAGVVIRVQGIRVSDWVLGIRLESCGLCLFSLGFMMNGLGSRFRLQGSGFRING